MMYGFSLSLSTITERRPYYLAINYFAINYTAIRYQLFCYQLFAFIMDSSVLISIICSFVLAVLLLIGLIYQQSNGMINIVSKKLFMYLVTSLFLFAGLGAIVAKFGSLTKSFWLLEFLLFCLGIAYTMTIHKTFAWADKNKLLPAFWFGLVILAFGATGFSGSYSFLAKKSDVFVPEILIAFFTFLLPYIFTKTYEAWESIPPKIYQKWYFPRAKPIPIVELRDTIALNFKITKRPNIPDLTNMTVKAPIEKTLSELYHYMIVSHNSERDAENPIRFLDDSGEEKPLGWIFYKEMFGGLIKKQFDFNKTIRDNQLKNNDVIVARSFTEINSL